ncbi:MAG: HAD-IA family hydrolase [Thermomicrobiales bacterium]|nr:HAD-IA family hydrolase [Thermomicrobiales bacterium]
MTPRYSTLIFDLDGTLADTLPLIYEAFNDALSPISGEQLSPEEIRGMFGPPDNYIIRELLDAEHHEAAIERYVATYQRRHRDLVDLFDGMADLLADAQAAGTKLAVVTGKSRSTAIMTLDILGVLGHFQVIYAGDDVERQKPDPMALVLALADLAHDDPASAAMIGDSAADVIAGKSAGVATIGVLWGSPDHTDLLAAGPDLLCATIDDLRTALGFG